MPADPYKAFHEAMLGPPREQPTFIENDDPETMEPPTKLRLFSPTPEHMLEWRQ